LYRAGFSKHHHAHDLEYELLAYAIDVVLHLGVRPAAKPYLALNEKHGSVLTSLATGEGLEVLRSLEGSQEGSCLHDYRNTSKIPVIVMDYINGMSDMKKDNYRLTTSPVSVTSAAYVHLL